MALIHLEFCKFSRHDIQPTNTRPVLGGTHFLLTHIPRICLCNVFSMKRNENVLLYFANFIFHYLVHMVLYKKKATLFSLIFCRYAGFLAGFIGKAEQSTGKQKSIHYCYRTPHKHALKPGNRLNKFTIILAQQIHNN